MTTPTATATATATIDLTQHSLHAVLARDKTLWQRPTRWTRAQLLALGVRHSRRRRRCGDEEDDSSDSEQEGDCDRDDGDDEETHHVVLPDLTEHLIGLQVSYMTEGASYEERVNFITALLRGARYLVPSTPSTPAEGQQIVDGVVYRPFTITWATPRLAVGPRTYNLHCLHHFLLGDKLVLPYVDSTAVLRQRWPVKRRRDRIRQFEPFITAVLISRAQSSCQPSCSSCSGTGDKNTENNTNANKLITTRLLFTHRDEKKYIHVYTAHISHALLDRFRHPNQPPATPSTDPLIRLDHRRIPYQPQNTFRQRLLAAVSITAVVKITAASSRKRPPSPDGCADTVKRPRLSDHPRRPFCGLDVNLELTSTSALRQRRPVPLCKLDAKLPPGSSWTARELATFRVVVKATNTRLHPFLLESTAACDDFLSNPAIIDLLQPTPTLWDRTESDLMTQYGGPLGQFWAALAEVVRLDHATGVKQNHDIPGSPLGQPTPKRNRIAVNHEDMVDSNTLQIGSSSPAQPSSQASPKGDAFVPADGAPFMTRDFNTQHLLSCFVRCALYSIPFDDWGKSNRIEVRTPVTATVTMSEGWIIQAEDDGGLKKRRRRNLQDHSPAYPYGCFTRSGRLVYCYDALFETKRGFGQIYNGRPSISDNWLGQMTAEALVGRLARAEIYNTEHIFVIAAARSFVCFLCFEISDAYLADIQGGDPTMVLPVTCTSWLDLNDYTERRYAAENIARLVRFVGR
ncbi:hypothetical protein GQX73_g4926 [Xylaria multiplex]|uniref:Uncharacterized protein n=1 Tax=Xylaria multiplex TaxID=323545 RepID=A0A7C8IXC8_9PEZI|nr:hypothetical protein GQX73_g4926 [Xylaria multiplex]